MPEAVALPPVPGSTPGEPMLPVPFRVRERRVLAADVVELDLVPAVAADDGVACRFRPGQFTMLYAFGVGEVPISIAGDPARPDVLRHVVRAVGPVTRALATAAPGTELGVRGPYGRGWPIASARGGDVAIVAGGIGLAPVMPIVHAIVRERARFRRVHVLVGARTPGDLLFGEELDHLAIGADLFVARTVDVAGDPHAPEGSAGGPPWTGPVGPVTTLIPGAVAAGLDASRTTVFTCGPEIMMRYVARAFTDAGADDARIHLSIERHMKCGIGLCGRCQLGPRFVCRDGPVWPLPEASALLEVAER